MKKVKPEPRYRTRIAHCWVIVAKNYEELEAPVRSMSLFVVATPVGKLRTRTFGKLVPRSSSALYKRRSREECSPCSDHHLRRRQAVPHDLMPFRTERCFKSGLWRS